MTNKTKLAFCCFIVSICSWIITLAITPVGGWCDSNPWREYYMTAFSITGVLSLVTLFIWLKLDK
jgi:MFS-type transporter involved in bile tolerance (Atg22 family)